MTANSYVVEKKITIKYLENGKLILKHLPPISPITAPLWLKEMESGSA
jgi:hypothetical protein